MLEKYKGKKVKILVSSKSGAGTSTSGDATIMSSVITIFGVIKDADERFIEIEGARSIYLDGFQKGWSSITPTVLDNASALISQDHIIAIYLIG